MIKVILDTNFITIPFQFKVDIYAELDRIIDENYKLVFPNICVDEIKRLRTGNAAMDLLKKKGVKTIDVPFSKNVDNSILDYAVLEQAILATQDIELKKKALKKGLTVITLRKKQFLIKLGGSIK